MIFWIGKMRPKHKISSVRRYIQQLWFRFPLDPLPYQLHFSGLGEVESAALKIEKKKRACVIANINAEESSALFRQFIDFCPENTTVRIELVRK